MVPPGGRRRYIVAERESFNSDWQRGVAEGWINPMTDAVVLTAIRDSLSVSPHSAHSVPDLPANVRTVRFPRSARYEQGRLEIEYEILEDDGRVWLARIRPIS